MNADTSDAIVAIGGGFGIAAALAYIVVYVLRWYPTSAAPRIPGFFRRNK